MSELINDALDVVHDAICNLEETLRNADSVNAEELGLDRRAGFVFVTDDAILVRSNCVRTLEYYGGFEYVEDDYKLSFGGVTVYFADSERVADCLDFYSGNS